MSFRGFLRLCSCIILYLYHSLSAFVSFSIRWTLLQRSVKRAQAGMLKAPSGWKWKLQSPAPFVSQVPLYSMDQRSDCGKNPMFHRVFIMFHHVSSLNCNTTVQWPWWGTWHVSSDWLERKHVSIVQMGNFRRETENIWKLLESANVKVEGRLVIAGARCKPSISTKTHTSGSVWRACTLKNLNRHQHHEIDGTEEIDWRWCKGRGY